MQVEGEDTGPPENMLRAAKMSKDHTPETVHDSSLLKNELPHVLLQPQAGLALHLDLILQSLHLACC